MGRGGGGAKRWKVRRKDRRKKEVRETSEYRNGKKGANYDES